MSGLVTWAKGMVNRRLPAGARFVKTGRWWLRQGEPEGQELPRLVEPGTVAIDVGAHFGGVSYALCRLVGRQGRVISIEPVAEDAAYLRKAARQLRLPMDVLACALSSKAGTAEFFVPVQDGSALTALSSLGDGSGAKGERRQVELKRLDDVTAPLAQRVSFVKIDVEGHELDVLAGAKATLAKHRPNLLIEIEQRHNTKPIGEVFATIEAQGYRGEFLDADRKVHPLSDFDVAVHQEAHRDDVDGAEYINNFIFKPVPGGADPAMPT